MKMLTEKYSGVIIASAALLVLMAAAISYKIPNALLPKLERPQIQLITSWPGKTAAEIEQALIAPLERQLHGISHLKNSQTNISHGTAWTNLNFHHQADMDKTYTEVLARVNRVPDWPTQVAMPRVIDYSNGGGATVASLFLYSKETTDKESLSHAYRAYVEPALASIPGITNINLNSNPLAQQIDIEFSPQKLAQYSLTIDQVSAQLQDLVDQSGDSLKLGSKSYDLHFSGQIPLNELLQMPVAVSGERIIRLKELAAVHKRFVHDWQFSAFKGHPAMYFYLQPDLNINVLEAIANIKQKLASLNDGPLAELDMSIELSRDNSVPIKNALLLVYGSLILGVLLASFFLYFFMRNVRVVLLIFVSIPVCLSIVVLLMFLGSKSINVISLAGMALSVGLLLDASIIVVESIQQLRSKGIELAASIAQGVCKVRGALISSTLSSIVIFVPILMMQSSAGQLFEDLAYTISSALIASILVALILLPAMARRMLVGKTAQHAPKTSKWSTLLSKPMQSKRLAWLVVLLAVPFALFVSGWAMPPLDMLPEPKEKIVMVYTAFDEPISVEAAEQQIGRVIEQRIKTQQQTGSTPSFDIHGLFCSQNYCLLYFYPEGAWDFDHFRQWVENNIVNDLNDTRSYVYQGNLLRLAMPNSRTSQLDLKGADLKTLQKVGQGLFAHLQQTFPNARVTEVTPMRNTATQIAFTPKADMLAHMHLSRADLNRYLVALTDGIYLGRYYTGNDTLPFYFKGQPTSHLASLLQTEIVLPQKRLTPLRELVDTEIVLAPSAIYRTDREVSVSMNLVPAEGQPVGLFIEQVKQQVNAYLSQSKTQGLFVNYRGSADQLSAFLNEFFQMFVIALLILLLLMRITLNSWPLAIAVLLSMPLAISGGMLSLQLLNLFTPQNLDVVTMIGFIILMGLVINNAILLASQYQQAMVNGATQHEAILLAVDVRKRPIYMSTGTSIFGMLPLMLSPGDGAEIYRGLAGVIVGGMSFSALFSLSFMSALLSMKIFRLKLSQ